MPSTYGLEVRSILQEANVFTTGTFNSKTILSNNEASNRDSWVEGLVVDLLKPFKEKVSRSDPGFAELRPDVLQHFLQKVVER